MTVDNISNKLTNDLKYSSQSTKTFNQSKPEQNNFASHLYSVSDESKNKDSGDHYQKTDEKTLNKFDIQNSLKNNLKISIFESSLSKAKLENSKIFEGKPINKSLVSSVISQENVSRKFTLNSSNETKKDTSTHNEFKLPNSRDHTNKTSESFNSAKERLTSAENLEGKIQEDVVAEDVATDYEEFQIESKQEQELPVLNDPSILFSQRQTPQAQKIPEVNIEEQDQNNQGDNIEKEELKDPDSKFLAEGDYSTKAIDEEILEGVDFNPNESSLDHPESRSFEEREPIILAPNLIHQNKLVEIEKDEITSESKEIEINDLVVFNPEAQNLDISSQTPSIKNEIPSDLLFKKQQVGEANEEFVPELQKEISQALQKIESLSGNDNEKINQDNSNIKNQSQFDSEQFDNQEGQKNLAEADNFKKSEFRPEINKSPIESESANLSMAEKVSSSEYTNILGLADLSNSAALKFAIKNEGNEQNLTSPLHKQLSIWIREAAITGKHTMNVTLTPETLGRLDIQLDIDQGNIKTIKILVHKAESLEMINNDSQNLRILEQAIKEISGAEDAKLTFDLKGQNGENAYQDNASQNQESQNLQNSNSKSYDVLKPFTNYSSDVIVSSEYEEDLTNISVNIEI